MAETKPWPIIVLPTLTWASSPISGVWQLDMITRQIIGHFGRQQPYFRALDIQHQNAGADAASKIGKSSRRVCTAVCPNHDPAPKLHRHSSLHAKGQRIALHRRRHARRRNQFGIPCPLSWRSGGMIPCMNLVGLDNWSPDFPEQPSAPANRLCRTAAPHSQYPVPGLEPLLRSAEGPLPRHHPRQSSKPAAGYNPTPPHFQGCPAGCCKHHGLRQAVEPFSRSAGFAPDSSGSSCGPDVSAAV